MRGRRAAAVGAREGVRCAGGRRGGGRHALSVSAFDPQCGTGRHSARSGSTGSTPPCSAFLLWCECTAVVTNARKHSREADPRTEAMQIASALVLLVALSGASGDRGWRRTPRRIHRGALRASATAAARALGPGYLGRGGAQPVVVEPRRRSGACDGDGHSIHAAWDPRAHRGPARFGKAGLTRPPHAGEQPSWPPGTQAAGSCSAPAASRACPRCACRFAAIPLHRIQLL